MKNIHVIPTSSPSKIFYIAENFHLEKGQLIEPKSYHNVYITSDEEIKEDDWGLSKLNEVILFGRSYNEKFYKKIILTTDQDLIADGVQAIDDTFLEWFVKNPSCKEVEVQKWFDGLDFLEYKIIIPQEEPKQETLEEAAEKEYDDNLFDYEKYRDGFIEGAKWMAERMYSEEDMFEFSQWISHEDWVYLPSKGYWVNEEQEELEQKLSSKEILNQWFEQFKKK